MTPTTREQLIVNLRDQSRYWQDAQVVNKLYVDPKEILKLLDQVAEALAAPPVATDGWQPISTWEGIDYALLMSPAHGRVIGAHVTGDVWHLVGVGAVTSQSERPTHWQPLPAPPPDAPQEKG